MAKAPKDVGAFLIANANGKTAGKGKAEIPVLEGHGDLADRAVAAYKEAQTAEAAFKLIEGEVLKLTDPKYETLSVGGEHTKSLNVPGTQTPGVQVSYPDKFGALDVGQEKGLREQLGSKFDTFFEQKRVVTLKPESTDDETVAMLMKLLGPEKFVKLFNIKVELVAKKDMDKKQFDLPEAVRILCGLKQAKPSLKIIKE